MASVQDVKIERSVTVTVRFNGLPFRATDVAVSVLRYSAPPRQRLAALARIQATPVADAVKPAAAEHTIPRAPARLREYAPQRAAVPVPSLAQLLWERDAPPLRESVVCDSLGTQAPARRGTPLAQTQLVASAAPPRFASGVRWMLGRWKVRAILTCVAMVVIGLGLHAFERFGSDQPALARVVVPSPVAVPLAIAALDLPNAVTNIRPPTPPVVVDAAFARPAHAPPTVEHGAHAPHAVKHGKRSAARRTATVKRIARTHPAPVSAPPASVRPPAARPARVTHTTAPAAPAARPLGSAYEVITFAGNGLVLIGSQQGDHEFVSPYKVGQRLPNGRVITSINAATHTVLTAPQP